jgi:hypothetical protein
MRLSLALFASLALAASSCGPGDALFRAFVSVGKIQVEAPSALNEGPAALFACDGLRPEDIQIDIGLMKIGEPGMQSIPRHLVIRPDQAGWIYETTRDGVTTTGVRIRGSRPQELQFKPGNYLLAITGGAKCRLEDGTILVYPLVYYSPQERPFAPGSEIDIVANAKFSGSGEELGYFNTSWNPSPGFAALSTTDLQLPTGSWTATLISDTSPALSTDLGTFTLALRIGPVPAMGRYKLRIRTTDSSSGALIDCREFSYEGTTPEPDLGELLPKSTAPTPCPTP